MQTVQPKLRRLGLLQESLLDPQNPCLQLSGGEGSPRKGEGA
jgi:hypothetical protein